MINQKKFIGLLILQVSFFILFSLSVDAQWCCLQYETPEGGVASCQNVATGASSCGSSLGGPIVGVSCSNAPDCRAGTCLDSNTGFCDENAPQGSCISGGGEWFDKPLNEVLECRQGCCILGSNTHYVTDIQCNVLSNNLGLEKDWDGGLTQIECLQVHETLSKGACIIPGKCEVITGSECQAKGGDFTVDSLCTDPDLDTGCEATENSACSEIAGDYNVYFVDSCGNLANVYDSSKKDDPAYWKNIQNPDDLCETDLDIDSSFQTCGQCNYPTESRCLQIGVGEGVGGSNNICKTLDCEDEGRLNGESWCVYESKIGEGKDVVGSDHYLKRCDEGVVRLEQNPSFGRNQICAEKNQDLNDGEPSKAQYRYNLWPLCIFPIADNTKREECNQNPDCRRLVVDINDYFNFEVCLPKYPIGPDFQDSAREDLCALADQTCVYVEYKTWRYGSWHDYGNTQTCKGYEFVSKMNQFCTALGDCGGKVNVEGNYQKYYNVQGSGDHNVSEEYLGNQIPEDSPAIPQFINNPSAPGSPDDFGDQGSVGPGPDNLEFMDRYEDFIFDGDDDQVIDLDALVRLFVFSRIGPIALVADWLDLGGETRETNINFVCQPWTPPPGGNCEMCNEGEFPCTKYKCNSLGSNCDLIDNNNPICVDKFSGDETPSEIGNLVVKKNNEIISTSPRSGLGFSIPECLDSYTDIEISFRTQDSGEDDYGLCRYSYASVPYSEVNEVGGNLIEVSSYSKGDGLYSVEHNFTEQLHILHEGIEPGSVVQEIDESTGRLNLYMRCMDPNGNSKNEEYIMEFCVSSKDQKAPYIKEEKLNPPNKGYLQYGVTEINSTIILNEPAECRYSYESGIDFELMSLFDSNNDGVSNCYLPDPTDPDFKFPVEGHCDTKFSNLVGEEENSIYIKCKDTNGNVNDADFLYELYPSGSPLKIDSIQPEGETLNKSTYFSIDLEVRTSGGSDNGNANCRYSFVESPFTSFSTFGFALTGAKNHKHVFDTLPSGNYDVKISCRDSAGNLAENNTKFKLKIDSFSPKVIRAFNEGGNLKVITDERAKCYYSNDKVKECRFNIDNAASMSSTYVEEHSAPWDVGKTYFVKCEDLFGNVNSNCAIKVNPA